MSRWPLSPVERFMSHMVVTEAGCWQWTSPLDHQGYPHLYYEGRTQRAHRVGYQLLVGPIPEGLTLDHLCRNRGCVNPEHLEPVTLKVNHERGARAQQTHCKRGHEFTPENTYVSAKNCRTCRRCQADAIREKRAAS